LNGILKLYQDVQLDLQNPKEWLFWPFNYRFSTRLSPVKTIFSNLVYINIK